jgi:hypothetical protein
MSEAKIKHANPLTATGIDHKYAPRWLAPGQAIIGDKALPAPRTLGRARA